MPRVVAMVPNPWLPYMDGQIWEFTEEEVRALPHWKPMHDHMGEVCGHAMIQWSLGRKVYIRFYDADSPDLHPSVLAGWVEHAPVI